MCGCGSKFLDGQEVEGFVVCVWFAVFLLRGAVWKLISLAFEADESKEVGNPGRRRFQVHLRESPVLVQMRGTRQRVCSHQTGRSHPGYIHPTSWVNKISLEDELVSCMSGVCFGFSSQPRWIG